MLLIRILIYLWHSHLTALWLLVLLSFIIYTTTCYFCFTEEAEESGKDWSDLEREAAEEDKKERNYERGGDADFDRKRKGGRDIGRYDEKKGKHDKSSHKGSSSNHKSSSSHSKSSSSHHKSSSHKSPSKNSSSR